MEVLCSHLTKQQTKNHLQFFSFMTINTPHGTFTLVWNERPGGTGV